MSQCTVPNWNLRQQRQEEQVEDREESNRSPHVQSDQNLCYVVPLCDNNEVRELTWQNGQISLHGFLPKQSWEGKAGDSTLESIVHQATTFGNNNVRLLPSPSYAAKWDENQHQKWRENSSLVQAVEHHGDEVKVNSTFCGEKRRPLAVKVNSTVNNNASCGEKLLGEKRVRCESQRRHGFHGEESACGSGSAAFCRGADTTMMTWASFESGRSLKSARTADDDSVYHDCSENQDGEGTTKEESYRSHSSARRSRAAAIHNLSERRRRDRINQKMKTLQKMVPNASKTDKASMLDEVIEYLKQLQAQVQMLSNARNMSQMVMPLGMQQQLQMSLLARMGMGIGMGTGMGMLDINNLVRNVPNSFPPLINAATALGGATPSFVSPPFTVPPVLVPPPIQLKQNVDHATIRTSVPNFNDAYNTFLAQQSMSMDFLNKMSALYRQQGSSHHPSNKAATPSLPNDGQS